MLNIIIYILIGLVGGTIGGMGMGGGTLLIPLLNIFSELDQHIAQSINLIAFIPMSVIALIIHFKNKLVKPEYFLYIAIPAVIISVPASIIASNTGGKTLEICFGVFLAILGVYQFISVIVKIVKARKNGKNE